MKKFEEFVFNITEEEHKKIIEEYKELQETGTLTDPSVLKNVLRMWAKNVGKPYDFQDRIMFVMYSYEYINDVLTQRLKEYEYES